VEYSGLYRFVDQFPFLSLRVPESRWPVPSRGRQDSGVADLYPPDGIVPPTHPQKEAHDRPHLQDASRLLGAAADDRKNGMVSLWSNLRFKRGKGAWSPSAPGLQSDWPMALSTKLSPLTLNNPQ